MPTSRTGIPTAASNEIQWRNHGGSPDHADRNGSGGAGLENGGGRFRYRCRGGVAGPAIFAGRAGKPGDEIRGGTVRSVADVHARLGDAAALRSFGSPAATGPRGTRLAAREHPVAKGAEIPGMAQAA